MRERAFKPPIERIADREHDIGHCRRLAAEAGQRRKMELSNAYGLARWP